MQITKILLPIDFSGQSDGAAHYAKALGCRFRSEIIIAHAFEMSRVLVNVPETGVPVTWWEEVRLQRHRDLEEFHADEFRSMPVKRIMLEGNVAHSIVSLAHSEKVDLIVMPTHGYG